MRAHLGKEAEHHATHRELGEKLVGENFCKVGPLGTVTIKEQHGVVRVEQKVLRDCESSQKRGQKWAAPVENSDQGFFFDASRFGALNEVIEPEKMIMVNLAKLGGSDILG